MVDIICPSGWNRVNISDQIYGGVIAPSPNFNGPAEEVSNTCTSFVSKLRSMVGKVFTTVFPKQLKQCTGVFTRYFRCLKEYDTFADPNYINVIIVPKLWAELTRTPVISKFNFDKRGIRKCDPLNYKIRLKWKILSKYLDIKSSRTVVKESQ